MIALDITERLRGKVRVPVNDGAGLLDGKDFFERSFPASKCALEAADEIDRLRKALMPFTQAKLPSQLKTEIDFNEHGLRTAMSPMDIARRDAKAALSRQRGKDAT